MEKREGDIVAEFVSYAPRLRAMLPGEFYVLPRGYGINVMRHSKIRLWVSFFKINVVAGEDVIIRLENGLDPEVIGALRALSVGQSRYLPYRSASSVALSFRYNPPEWGKFKAREHYGDGKIGTLITRIG